MRRIAGVAIATIAVAAVAASMLGALVAQAEPDGGLPPAAAPAPTTKSAGAGAPAGNVVRIVLTVLPSSKKAMVYWGKKRLGPVAPHQPLVIQRPRDSGPLDLIVRADGCVPVQTRAYTFADNKIAVKVTPNDQKNTLFGYHEELPPDGGAPNPDGGAR
jgi:hypothetical protein